MLCITLPEVHWIISYFYIVNVREEINLVFLKRRHILYHNKRTVFLNFLLEGLARFIIKCQQCHMVNEIDA